MPENGPKVRNLGCQNTAKIEEIGIRVQAALGGVLMAHISPALCVNEDVKPNSLGAAWRSGWILSGTVGRPPLKGGFHDCALQHSEYSKKLMKSSKIE